LLQKITRRCYEVAMRKRSKRGAVKKPERMIGLRLTAEEYARIETAAKAACRSVASEALMRVRGICERCK